MSRKDAVAATIHYTCRTTLHQYVCTNVGIRDGNTTYTHYYFLIVMMITTQCMVITHYIVNFTFSFSSLDKNFFGTPKHPASSTVREP